MCLLKWLFPDNTSEEKELWEDLEELMIFEEEEGED